VHIYIQIAIYLQQSDSVTSESQSRGDSVASLGSQAEEYESSSGHMSVSPMKASSVVLSKPPPKSKRSSMFGLFKKKESNK
jgi:hypothetical protein